MFSQQQLAKIKRLDDKITALENKIYRAEMLNKATTRLESALERAQDEYDTFTESIGFS